MNKQSYKYLFSGFNPRYFAWGKRQPICESNLIPHISVRSLLSIWVFNTLEAQVRMTVAVGYRVTLSVGS